MKSIYAIAYMTESLDGEKDIYVEIVSASSRAEAIGLSMEEGRGCEVLAQGEKIVSYNVAEQDKIEAICDTLAQKLEAHHG